MESAGNFVSVSTISRGRGENHITEAAQSWREFGIFGKLVCALCVRLQVQVSFCPIPGKRVSVHHDHDNTYGTIACYKG